MTVERASSELRLIVGANIKELRSVLAWRQEDLAEAMTSMGCDWKRITVAEVERGTRRVSLEELICLASVFVVPVAVLLAAPPDTDVLLPGQRRLDGGVFNAFLRGRMTGGGSVGQCTGP